MKKGGYDIMNIKKLVLKNFQGINGVKEVVLPHTSCLIGENGIGKTSLLNAIRYAITGEKPEGDIINKFAEDMMVEITIESEVDGSDHTFTRIESREKPSKFMVDGKSSTLKSMNEFLCFCTGMDKEQLKILTSAEVVSKMKPHEFGTFLMTYVEKKFEKEEIIKLVPDKSAYMESVLMAQLPDEVDIKDCDNLLALCKEERKSTKKDITGFEGKIRTMVVDEPSEKMEDIEKELEKIKNVEQIHKIYEVESSAYETAMKNLSKWKEKLQEKEEELEKYSSAARPDYGIKEKMLEERKDIQESLENLQVTKKGLQASKSELEKTLKALDSSRCPISPLICCHEDKTVAKEEIAATIDSNEKAVQKLNSEMEKLETKKEENEANLKSFEEEVLLYNKKIQISKEIMELKETISGFKAVKPKKPDTVDKETLEKREFQLNSIKKSILLWEEKKKTEKKLEMLKQKLKDLEILIKSFGEKGAIRKKILSAYTGVLESVCNEVVEMIRPELHFTFEVNDGISILMDAGSGCDLPFSSLSGGEKAYFLFVIMTMLNRLAGSKILFLDELSVMDSYSFETLIEIIEENKEEYDHIMIAAVNHEDTVKSLKRYGIEELAI